MCECNAHTNVDAFSLMYSLVAGEYSFVQGECFIEYAEANETGRRE